jgi:hypothetical protein
VRLDGGLRDAEVESDLFVQSAGLQPFQDAQLRRRQAGNACSPVVVNGDGQVRRPAVASQNGGDRLHHLRQRRRLGNETGRAQAQGVPHYRRLLASRNHRDRHRRVFGPDGGQSRHAFAVRQLQVQQQQIDRTSQRRHGLRQAGALLDGRAGRRLVDGGPKGGAKQRMVVGDDDAIHEASFPCATSLVDRGGDSMARFDFGRK